MMKWLLLVSSLLLVGQAFAVVDSDDDMMGLYFDTQANEFCVDNIPPFAQVPIHLILTRPTADVIYGFEAGCDMVGEGLVVTHMVHPNGGIQMQPWDNLIMGLIEPYPTSEATLLVTYQVLYMGTMMEPLLFYLHGTTPSSGDPAYPSLLLADGSIQSIGLSAEAGPTAQINGACSVVSAEKVDFGAIKSLYR